jgi:hypothetical protein
MQIVHMQPLVSSLSASDRLVQPLRKDSKKKCSRVLQCSDGLSNKVSNIIRRLMDNMKLLLICILRVLLSQSFIFFRFYFLSMYIWFHSRLIM